MNPVAVMTATDPLFFIGTDWSRRSSELLHALVPARRDVESEALAEVVAAYNKRRREAEDRSRRVTTH